MATAFFYVGRDKKMLDPMQLIMSAFSCCLLAIGLPLVCKPLGSEVNSYCGSMKSVAVPGAFLSLCFAFILFFMSSGMGGGMGMGRF